LDNPTIRNPVSGAESPLLKKINLPCLVFSFRTEFFDLLFGNKPETKGEIIRPAIKKASSHAALIEG
jgi:hypothetical protein